VGTNAVAYPMVDFYSSLAAGLGFGATYTIMLYGTILSYSSGPGALWSDTCSRSTFVVSAWTALVFCALHVVLMIIAYDAYRRSSVPRVLLVAGIHLIASLLTLLNERQDGCQWALPLDCVILFLSVCILLFIIRKPDYRSKRRM